MSSTKNNEMDTVFQDQNGSLSLSQSGQVAMFSAGPKASKVGKSAVIQHIDPMADADLLNVSTGFMIPKGAPTDSIMLMDFESAGSNIDTNPGTRIYLRDGQLRVDRSKIGIEESWNATQAEPIRPGAWHDLRVAFDAGVGQKGGIKIYLDGKLVLDETGTTVLTQNVLGGTGITHNGAGIDRVQAGLTANSNDVAATVALRDLKIAVEDRASDQTTRYDPDWTKMVESASTLHADGSENAPSIVKQNPTMSDFGVNKKGSAQTDELIGTFFDDVLSGGGGDDVLDGGLGEDTLHGGKGADSFLFREGMNVDVISDFEIGLDKIIVVMSEMDPNTRFDTTDTNSGLLVHDGESGFLLTGIAKSDFQIDDFVYI